MQDRGLISLPATNGNELLTNLANSSGAATSAETDHRFADRNAQTRGDVRSTVARKFMHMLAGHDRARLESLASYRPQW
jgi:hypothetical protein